MNATREDPRTSLLPKLAHVARLSGVGMGTASRALNNQGSVSDDAMRRVLQAANQLGYQPNEIARSLKRRTTDIVGIVVPDLGDVFFTDCVRGAQQVIREHDYISTLAFSHGESAVEAREMYSLARRQVAGLLIVPTDRAAAHYMNPFFQNLPVVAFDQPVACSDCDSLLVGNRGGAQAGARHLLEHGHKHIACLGIHSQLHSMQERMFGYMDAVAGRGYAPIHAWVEDSNLAMRSILRGLLSASSPPTALFCLNGCTSIRALKALSQLSIRIPQDLAFVGFDELPLGELINPPVTVVAQDATEIGRYAAMQIFGRLAGERTSREMNAPMGLTIRRSCGCEL